MKKLTWWCRIIGAFNLLLGLSGLVYVVAAPSVLAESLPYADADRMARAYGDAWFAFACDLVIIGVALLWISKHPERNLCVVWLAIAGEATHGIGHDIFLIARGYAAGGYIGFAVVEVVIIVTGVVFALGARRQLAAPAEGPVHDGSSPGLVTA